LGFDLSGKAAVKILFGADWVAGGLTVKAGNTKPYGKDV